MASAQTGTDGRIEIGGATERQDVMIAAVRNPLPYRVAARR